MRTRSQKTSSVIRAYASYVFKYPFLFSAIIVAVIVAQIAILTVPLYLRQFINLLATSTPSAAIVSQLILILGIILIIWCIEWAAERIRYFSTVYIEARVMTDLMSMSFEYLLGHSHTFFSTQFSGSLTHRVGKFSRAFEVLFDSIFGNFLATVVFLVGAVSILFARNATLGTALAIWIVAFLAFQVTVARLRAPARRIRAAADTKVTANLADAISNQATIVLFSGWKYEAQRFAETVRAWQRATIRSWSADAWIWAGIGLFIIVIEAILLYGGVYYWQRGQFTVGDFVLIQAYLFAAFERLAAVNREFRRVSDAYSDAREMIEILNTRHEILDPVGALPLNVTKGEIVFADVAFHFHEERAIFNDFSVHISAGEKVALVGPSGAGKSTITKLLLRLFDVKKGAIAIDGQNIASVTQESLRSAISFVPQESVLFHRTLKENIRYGKRDATDEDIIAAAKKAHCHEFIEKLEHGYDTYVGERGIKLSGGERQRVAIARAILKNAPILILDEATSSLDSTSELLIQDALAELMKGKTVIVIAHRLSTIMKMDRILVIEDGAISEEGTHQALIAAGGAYATLWSHQAGGFMTDGEDSLDVGK